MTIDANHVHVRVLIHIIPILYSIYLCEFASIHITNVPPRHTWFSQYKFHNENTIFTYNTYLHVSHLGYIPWGYITIKQRCLIKHSLSIIRHETNDKRNKSWPCYCTHSYHSKTIFNLPLWVCLHSYHKCPFHPYLILTIHLS